MLGESPYMINNSKVTIILVNMTTQILQRETRET